MVLSNNSNYVGYKTSMFVSKVLLFLALPGLFISCMKLIRYQPDVCAAHN